MTFAETVSAAVRDFIENGFDSEERLNFWLEELRRSARAQGADPAQLQNMMDRALRSIYERLVERAAVLQQHSGVSRFTLHNISPRLRAELDRRLLASANLIKLNRDEAIEKTLRRFSGWATSIPAGGAREASQRETAEDVKKSMKSLPFKERRVIIDQSHKLTASINAIVAEDGGAIAFKWRSHWRQAGYDYREDHKERDGKIYLIRDNWAQRAGFVKPGPAGYSDEITQVGEEIFCRCFATYLYSLRQLPDNMITEKGREELARVRRQVA